SYMAEDPDPSTKWKNEASIIGDNAQLTGLWFEKDFDGKAPVAPADFKATVGEKSPNTVNLSWTLPEEDLDGNAVTVSAVNVYRFGNPEAIATLAGDATSYTDEGAPNGTQNYMVSAVADELQGRGAVASVYVGADELMPVSDLEISLDGAAVTLTWKAPTATYNGGYADFDNITYIVWRIKGDDEQIVASDVKGTTYVDELTEAGTYYYSIVPVSCEVEGYAADSAPVTYTKTASIPYISGFEDDQDGSLWTTFNNHSNTSYGWTIQLGYAYQRYEGKFAQLKSYSSSEPCDDYMFSPAIEFAPGTYQLNYMVNGSLSTDPHSWSIYIADGATPDAGVVAEIESHENEVVGSSWIESDGATFTIEEAGLYHIAFHGTTTATYCTLKIDNVSVTKAPASVPYACDFEEGSDVDSWKIDNTNPHLARGAGWSLVQQSGSTAGSSVVKLYVYSVSDGEYDDWMVSPAINFPEAGEYTLTFEAKGASWDTHKWGAYLGTDPDDYTTFDKPIVEYDKAKFTGWTDYTADFKVDEPGTYHVGLNAKGCDTATSLYLDNVRVDRKGSSGISDVVASEDAEIVGYYNLQGQQIERPAEGLVIVRYSNGTSRKVVIK
ncbi:MAG: fibronectin type III domain-containing protein, partial [Muribaculaceae bacterium]|nr:fibronectin type III domain-containing protein [Muribaculaceae bacterium]